MKRGLTAFLLILALRFAPAAAAQSDVVGKSMKAIGYQVGSGATKTSLRGTELVPQAGGEAKVEAKKGITTIQVAVSNLVQPSRLGTEFSPTCCGPHPRRDAPATSAN